jgi:hypothetical protein
VGRGDMFGGSIVNRPYRIVIIVCIAGAAVTAAWLWSASRAHRPKSGADAGWLKEQADAVKAGQADKIDTHGHPKITDSDLAVLADLTALKELNLDHTLITDEGIKQVIRAPNVRSLSFTETQITDSGLAELGPLTGLQFLRLDATGVTDAGLAHLRAFPRVWWLSLYQTAITDAGLVHLKRLTALQHLSLDKTLVTDDGLRQLSEFPSLKYVSVWETQVTDAGVGALQTKRPDLKINR